jgi:hypothetical protein
MNLRRQEMSMGESIVKANRRIAQEPKFSACIGLSPIPELPRGYNGGCVRM